MPDPVLCGLEGLCLTFCRLSPLPFLRPDLRSLAELALPFLLVLSSLFFNLAMLMILLHKLTHGFRSLLYNRIHKVIWEQNVPQVFCCLAFFKSFHFEGFLIKPLQERSELLSLSLPNCSQIVKLFLAPTVS